MLSAPPVLVEPKSTIVSISSPPMQEHFDWATQTPEPSPMWHPKVPLQQASDHFSRFQNACNPYFEQMLIRVSSHVDVLEATDASDKHQLIQTLCQPFFGRVVDALHREISCVRFPSSPEVDLQKITNAILKDEKPRLSLGQRLGLWEDDSTDAENDSAFASLFSSDGEDCEAECREEVELAWQSSHRAAPMPFENDSETSLNADTTQMVCRHWKSKGWCRYASECKFLHPENKRGVCAKGPKENVSSSSRCMRKRGGTNKTDKIQAGSVAGSMVAWDSSICCTTSCGTYLPFTSTLCREAWLTELHSH